MSTCTPVTTPALNTPDTPGKPWDGFPLYWHKRGYWMCKRDGREWRYEADAHRSYARFLTDDAARKNLSGPLRSVKRYFLRDAVNLYLTRQKRRLDEFDISPVQFARCRRELETMLPKAVSLNTPLSEFSAREPDDRRPGDVFARIRRRSVSRGLQAAEKHIGIVRAMLDYAARKHLMRAPDYGDDFDKPTVASIRKSRQEKDAVEERAWTREQLRKILAQAKRQNEHLYAQILLALFCGFGSDDCSAVPESAVDLKRRVVTFPRVKNGRQRMAGLPHRVIEAIEASIKTRKPASTVEARPLLFRTVNGTKCNAAKHTSDEKGVSKVGRNDTIGKNFTRLLAHKGVKLSRKRTGFKSLRAMCRTLLVGAGVDRDIVAVIMGREFQYPIDEYYIRGGLRSELFKAARHIEAQIFPRPKRTG